MAWDPLSPDDGIDLSGLPSGRPWSQPAQGLGSRGGNTGGVDDGGAGGRFPARFAPGGSPDPDGIDLSGLPGPDPRGRAARNLARLGSLDPDGYARARRTADRMGLDLTAFPSPARAVKKLDPGVGLDFDFLEKYAPLTLGWLADLKTAALIKDDVPQLARLERRVSLLSPGERLSRAVDDMRRQEGRQPSLIEEVDQWARKVADWSGEHLPVVGWWIKALLTGGNLPEPVQRLSRDFNVGWASVASGVLDFAAELSDDPTLRRESRGLVRLIEAARVEDPSLFDEIVSAAGSMAPMLLVGLASGGAGLSPWAAAALAKGSSAGLEAMAEGGKVMREALDQGGSHADAVWAGLTTAVLNLPLNYFLNILGGPEGGRFLKRFFVEGAKEGGQESLQGVISDVATKWGKDPDQLTVGDLLNAATDPDRAKEFLIGGVLGGLMGAALDTSGHKWRQGRPRLDEKGLVKAIAATAQQSKLAQRDPGAFDKLADHFLEKNGAPRRLFFPARQMQTLFQEALDKQAVDPLELEEALDRAGLDLKRLQDAADLDESLELQTAKTRHLVNLLPQAAELFQSEMEEPEGVTAALRELVEDQVPLPHTAMEEFARQAIAAGMDPQVARDSALVYGHRARIWAIYTGKDPAQWFQEKIDRVIGPGSVAPPTGGRRGRAERLFIPGQRPRVVRYELREARELVPSHDPHSFAPRQDYPAGIQERDYRGEPEEQAKVIKNARMGAPEYFVNTNPDAINGPPIVTKDGVVLGGNSRVMSLMRAYGEGKAGKRYRRTLADRARVFGLEPSQVLAMEQPVLVRVLETKGSDPKALHGLVSALNAPPTQAMGEEATAVSRGKNTSQATLEMIARNLAERDTTVRGLLDDPKAAREVLDALGRDGVIKSNETNLYWSNQHKRITNQGKHLVESALLGAVLPDYNLLRVAPPWLRQHLARNLDHLARLKARGEDWDLTSDLRQAVELVLAAEASPGPVDRLRQFLAQMALPGTERIYSPRAVALAMALIEKKPKELRAALKALAADAAADVPRQQSLVPVKSAAESFAEHIGRVESLGQAAAMRRSGAESLPEFVAQVRKGEGDRKEFFDLDAPSNVQRLAADALGQVPEGTRLVVAEDTVRHVDKRRREFAEVAWDIFPDLARVVDEVYLLPSRGQKWGQPLVFIKRLPGGVLGFLAQFRPSFGGHFTVATYFGGSERQLKGWLKQAGAEKKGSLDAGGSPADPSLARVQDVVQRNPSIFNLRHAKKDVNPLQGSGQDLLDQAKRGAVHFGPDGKAVIQLFKDADASTLIHELAHIARRDLAELAAQDDVPQRVKRDWREMCRFVGADPADPWTVEQEEKLAQAFERYLMEGRAPSSGLRGAFERFRRWLLDLYRGLRGRRLPINHEIREVFDRLLATDAEIAQARAEAEIHPWLRPEDIPFSERQGYQDLVEAARAQAAQNVMAHRLKDYKKHLAAWRREGKELADAIPGHQILDQIMKAGGLSARSLEALVDRKTLGKLAKKRVGLVRKQGQDFVEVAFAHDMTPVQLLDTILNTPAKKEIIDQHVKKQSAAYQAETPPFELAVSRELETLLEKEAELLAKKAGANLVKSFRKVFNADEVSVADLEEMRMDELRADYRRVARLALEAYQGGRLEAAAEHRQRQAAKARKLRLAAQARREIRAHKRYLKRVVRQKEKPLENLTGIAEPWLQQIRALVGRYQTLPDRFKAPKDTPSLAEFIEELPEEDRPPIDEEIIHQTGPWSLAELQERAFTRKDGRPRKRPLTLLGALDRGMLAELVEAVKVLEHMGRNEKYYVAFHKQMALGQAVAELVEAVNRNHPDKLRAAPGEITVGETPGQAARREASEIAAWLEIPEFTIRRLDGWQDLGPVWELVFKPINDAANRELEMTRQATQEMNRLYELVPPKVRKGWAKRRHIEGLSQTLTGQECLCAALNAGNPENLEALQTGYGWSDEQLKAVLDSLTKEEWDFVQAAWDYLDSFFPQIDEVYYQLYGRRMVKVTPQEIETKYGTYRGGYYPLVFDKRKSKTISRFKQREIDLEASEHEFQIPFVQRGFTKKRKGGKYPVTLDLSVLANHVGGAIHFITHAETVHSVHRLLKDEDAAAAIEAAVGPARHKQLLTWLVGVARPRRILSGPGEAWLKALNDNYVTAALAYNLMTAVKQPLALFQGAARVGVRPLLHAMWSVLAHPLSTIRMIQQMSPYMQNRQKSLDRDLVKTIRQGWGGPEAWGQKYVREWGLKHIGFMDTLTAYPVWLDAYNQGLAKYHGDETKAVDFADMQVRHTQGSGLPKDLAKVMRGGELWRSFTMFYTFFSSTYNLMREEGAILAHSGFSPRAAMRFTAKMTLIWMLPAVLEGMMNQREGWEPEDVLWDLLAFPFQTVPVIRDVVSAVKGYRFGGGPVAEVLRQGGEVARILGSEDPDYLRLADKGLRFVGGLPLQRWGVPGYAGLPSNQFSTALKGAQDLAEGETDVPEGFAYLFVRRKER